MKMISTYKEVIKIYGRTSIFRGFCSKTPKSTYRKRPTNSNMIEKFEEMQKKLESNLKINALCSEDLAIHNAHKEAAKNYFFTYDDPETGYKVMTRLKHFLREKCCGNAYRHCVYDHENVPKERYEQRMFNGSFWKDKPVKDTEPPLKKSTKFSFEEFDSDIQEVDPKLFRH